MSNPVPVGWSARLFSDAVTLVYGKSPKDILENDGAYPVIGTGGITGLTNSFLHEGKTTVIGRKGTINKPSYIETKFWAIDTTYYVTNYKRTDPKWFFYLLQDIDLTKYNEASGVPSLNRDTLYAIPYISPPLPEQQKIAKILTSVDEVIEKTQAQIDKLKDLKTGMMQELLTKGVGVDGKPHTEFKDSPVGRIPKTWKVVSLSSVAERIGDGIHATPKYVDKSDYPFINGNNLKDGKIFVGSNTRFVSLEEYEKHRTELSDSTILMSINGTIGNLAYYLNEPVVLGKSAAYISLAEGVSKSFIYYVLGSDYVREFYELELTGTTIRNLSLKAIRATPIALPPAVEQDDIARVLSALDENIKLLSSQLSQKMSLKKALMQDLLTGKVRVTID